MNNKKVIKYLSFLFLFNLNIYSQDIKQDTSNNIKDNFFVENTCDSIIKIQELVNSYLKDKYLPEDILVVFDIDETLIKPYITVNNIRINISGKHVFTYISNKIETENKNIDIKKFAFD